MEILNNPTHLDRTNLVWEWLLDWDAKDTWWSNNGTATNVTWVASDRWYTSEVGSFNGTSSKITFWNTGLPTWNNSISVNFWINTDTITWYTYPFFYWTEATNQALLVALDWINNDGTLTIGKYNSNIIESVWAIAIWKWSMVTLTHDGTTVKLYLNWVFDNSATTSLWIVAGTNYLGWDKFSGWANWRLWLARIYNTALSQQQIDALYIEWLRRFWPKDRLFNNTAFSKYSLPNLESWKVLEISKAAVSWTYYDQSGNGNNWTPTSVTDTAVGLNNVMTFNGSTSYVTINNWVNTDNDFSLSVWVSKTLLDTSIKYIWCDFDDRNCVLLYDWGLSLLYFQFYDWATTYKASIPYSLLVAWDIYNVTATRNKTTWMKIYLNWVFIASNSYTWNWETLTLTSTLWRHPSVPTTYNLDWDIALVKIYNRTLSAQEVQQLYYSNFIAN